MRSLPPPTGRRGCASTTRPRRRRVDQVRAQGVGDPDRHLPRGAAGGAAASAGSTARRGAWTSRFYLQRFTPRRARSIWSKRNREFASALIEAGGCEPAGLREVERAKADGRWDAAYDAPSTATVPDDLQAALDANPAAAAFFATLNRQNRYSILRIACRPRRSRRRGRAGSRRSWRCSSGGSAAPVAPRAVCGRRAGRRRGAGPWDSPPSDGAGAGDRRGGDRSGARFCAASSRSRSSTAVFTMMHPLAQDDRVRPRVVRAVLVEHLALGAVQSHRARLTRQDQRVEPARRDDPAAGTVMGADGGRAAPRWEPGQNSISSSSISSGSARAASVHSTIAGRPRIVSR